MPFFGQFRKIFLLGQIMKNLILNIKNISFKELKNVASVILKVMQSLI
jgi:hypothetical protein